MITLHAIEEEAPRKVAVFRVERDVLPTLWPSLIALTMDRGALVPAYNMHDLRACLDDGTLQLWVAMDSAVRAAVITEIWTGRDRKLCKILHCIGRDFADWRNAVAKIEEWALTLGCDRVTIPRGRAAWQRLLGYEPVAVVLEKELGDDG